MKVQIIMPGPYQQVKTDKGGQTHVGAQFLEKDQIADFSDSYAEWCINNGYVKEPSIEEAVVKKPPPAIPKMQVDDVPDFPTKKKPAAKRPTTRRVTKKPDDDN